MTSTTNLPLHYAKVYLLGMFPIPVPVGRNGPVIQERQELRLSKDALKEHFAASETNTGIILGIDGFAYVDSHTIEAVRAAHSFLAYTASNSGVRANRHHITSTCCLNRSRASNRRTRCREMIVGICSDPEAAQQGGVL